MLEWTEDCLNDSNPGNCENVSARTGGDCSWRVLRGGSWGSYPQELHAAHGVGYNAGTRISDISFRLAYLFTSWPTPRSEPTSNS